MIDLTHFGLSPDLLIRLREGRTIPTGGIWYWFPTPEGWDLLGFTTHGPLTATTPPDDQANVFHVQEFEEIVEHMTKAWRLDSLPLTRDTYQGIPRGRVSKDAEGTWKLEHGSEFATRHIKQLFGLNRQPCQEVVIEHEMTNPRHVEIVEKTILYKTEADGRLVHAFEALRNHQAIPGMTRSLSANAQVSISIEDRQRRNERDNSST